MSLAFKQYAALLKALLRNINLRPRKNGTERLGAKMRIGKVGTIVLAALGVIAILAYEVMVATSLTSSVLDKGLTDEHLYTFLLAAQFVVFFFGVPTVMSNLYFSSDNSLLSSLPFEKGVVFAAKFTVSYLGELLIACLFVIPTTITAGIIATLHGIAIPWYFYPAALLAAVASPALPLIVITLIALPLMRVITLLKRNMLGYSIVMALIYCLFIGAYFAMIFVVNSMGSEEGGLSATAVNALMIMKKIGIFNYPIVSLMTGVKPLANLAIFVFGHVALFAIAVVCSFFFYGKAVTMTAESGSGKGQHKVKLHEASKAEAPRSLFKAFIFKEFKTLLNTPTLFMSVLLSLILPPIMMVFMHFTLGSNDMSDMFGDSGSDMFLVGFITYIVYLLSGMSNPVSSIGFSREGKNLPFLKSLPISAEVLVKAKLLFAMVISLLFTIAIGVSFPFAMGIYDPVAIICMPIFSLISGFGANCMMLYNDLKDPNYTWININEITRNNKRMLKPMLLSLFIGLFYMIFAIVLDVFLGGVMSDTAVFAIFFGVALIAPTVIAIVYYGKLTANPQELLDKIGG